MINLRLSLTHFRNHHQTDVEWGEKINIITGPNGAGKTNLLDAIHYLCMSKSFSSSSDQYVVQKGYPSFLIKGAFKGNIRKSFEISCSYGRQEGKKLWINDSPIERFSDVIGRVPVVLVSPEDKKLTGEGPVERRAFIDAFISQASPLYLQEIIRYRKIIRQRNRLLSDAYGAPSRLKALLEPWNLQLLKSGTKIIHKRSEIVRTFQHFLEKAHKELADSDMMPSLYYKTLYDTSADEVPAEETIYAHYEQTLDELFQKETERQQTMAGPHRDDLVFFLDGMELRKFGSQGQHRIFALALKMAQLYYYSEQLEDHPILLLDDLFGGLDLKKTEIIMNMLLEHPAQSFITAAHGEKIPSAISSQNTRISCYFVQDGKLKNNP